MAKKTILLLFPIFALLFAGSSSYAEDVFLAIGSGSGDPGSKNVPITVSLDNSADRVKGISFQIPDIDRKTYLSVASCEGVGRASEFSCQNNTGLGYSQILLFGMGDVIEEGNGPILTIYYNVAAGANPGESLVLKPNNVRISSDTRVIQQGRNVLKVLTVAKSNGRFLITGESDEEEEDSPEGSANNSRESLGDSNSNQPSAGSNRINFADRADNPTASMQKTDPTAKRSLASSRRSVSTRKTTAPPQESRQRNPSGTTTLVPGSSGSSGTRVIVSPESVTLTSGDLITLDPQTLDDGTVVEGDYMYEITPPSPIGSTVSNEGQFKAGVNTSFENVEERIKVTDTAHKNASTFVIIIVAGIEQPSSGCELSISPSSATLFSGDSIAFSVQNVGKKCSDGLYEWKVNSKIGSTINQQGVFSAGNNKGIDPVLDIVMVTDTANELSTDVIITVSGALSSTLNPQPVGNPGRTFFPKIPIVLTILIIGVGILVFRTFKH